MYNDKKLLLSIEKSLAEKNNSIIYSMENNKRNLLISRMKTGKTYLTANILQKHFNNKGVKIIFIAPTNILITQFIERYGHTWRAHNSKYKSVAGDMAVITTPDSLLNVIELTESINKKYVLVVDECQEVELSQGFRPSFKNISIAEKNKLCISSLHLTATPQNILFNTSSIDKFDRIIEIEQDDNFTFNNGNLFTLMSIKNDIYTKVHLLEKLVNFYGYQVFYKVDSYEDLEQITEIFNKLGIEGHTYLSSQNKEDSEIYELIKKDKIIDSKYRIVGFTSLVNSGVEIKTDNDHNFVCVVNFTNKTFNFTNEIQMIGRFREGVDRYIITIPKNEPDEEIPKKIKPYEVIYDKLLLDAEKFINLFNDIYKNTTLYSLQAIKTMVYSCTSKCIKMNELTREFTIDLDLLAKQTYTEYIRQYLKKPAELLKLFKKCDTLNFNSYVLDETPELYFEAGICEAINEVKDKKEFIKESLKEEFKYHCEEMLKFDSETLLAFLEFNPSSLNAENKDLYNTWYELTEQDEEIERNIKELRACEIGLIDAFKILATKSDSKRANIIKTYKYINFLKTYNDDKKAFKSYTSRNLNYKRFYKTMEYIEPRFKNGYRLTETDFENLSKIYKSIKISKYVKKELYVLGTKTNKLQLNNVLKQDVLQYLKLFCKITSHKRDENKNLRYYKFSSYRKNLDDLI